jgi:hypothetical protein
MRSLVKRAARLIDTHSRETRRSMKIVKRQITVIYPGIEPNYVPVLTILTLPNAILINRSDRLRDSGTGRGIT